MVPAAASGGHVVDTQVERTDSWMFKRAPRLSPRSQLRELTQRQDAHKRRSATELATDADYEEEEREQLRKNIASWSYR